MSKKIILISIIIILILLHKIIISRIALSAFEKWMDKDIKIEKFDISYSGNEIILNGINVFNNEKNFYEKVFSAKRIKVKFQPKSIFSDLVIIENLKILDPVININFKILDEKKGIIDDNIGILKNLDNKSNPKIYPKKIIDINFLVMKMKLDNFGINIYRSDIKKEINFNLSNINFAPFGNEKGYQHYKDIFKIILIDIVMRIPDRDLKQKVLKKYKIQ
tara:strand:+ start:1545 stop:2204 length:660 start_codon:yes stop_codon:yes gene_type:complete